MALWMDRYVPLVWNADILLLCLCSALAWLIFSSGGPIRAAKWHSVKEIEDAASGSRLASHWKRVDALAALAESASQKKLSILKETLRSSDEDLSYFSVLALGRLKSPEAAEALFAHLRAHPLRAPKTASVLSQFPASSAGAFVLGLDDTEAVARYWSLRLLAKLEIKSSSEKAALLARDPSADVRAAACLYLGQVGGAPAEEALLGAAKDPVWYVRMQAVRALAKQAPEKHAALFVEALAQDPSGSVKAGAAQALAGNLEKALPSIRGILREGSQPAKRACVGLLVETNGVSDILAGILSGEPAKRRDACGFLKDLFDTGIHAGVGRKLARLKPAARLTLIRSVAETNGPLAKKLQAIHENIR